MENVLPALLIVVLIFLGKTYGLIPWGLALLVPDVGEVRLLEIALKTRNQTLKLYVNDKTPAEGDTAASYTEMSTCGYAAKTLTAGSWSISSAGGITTASYAQQIWTFTAGGPTRVYGYFIVDTLDGTIVWAERFAVLASDCPLIQYDGDQIKVTPKFTGE